MFKDVTVEHPIAGIVGDKRDLHGLTRRYENCVLPFPVPSRFAVSGEHSKDVTVQVHRVMPGGLVGHLIKQVWLRFREKIGSMTCPCAAMLLIAQTMPWRIMLRMSIIRPWTIAPIIIPIMPPLRVT
jgi:hypothetical protein